MGDRSGRGRERRFSGRLAVALPRTLVRPGRVLGQVFANLGRMALPAIVAGVLAGALLAGYGRDAAALPGPVGAFAATLLVRDLGPALVALLFAGHVGLALALDVERMHRTDQLAALEMMGLDPFDRIVAPRAAAAMLSLPLLGALFAAAGIGGAGAVAAGVAGLDPRALWIQAAGVLPELAAAGIVKSLVFGLVVGWIALSAGLKRPDPSRGTLRGLPRMVACASLVVLALEAAFVVVPMVLP